MFRRNHNFANLFYNKASFSKEYRVKSIRLAVLQGIP